MDVGVEACREYCIYEYLCLPLLFVDFLGCVWACACAHRMSVSEVHMGLVMDTMKSKHSQKKRGRENGKMITWIRL